MPDKFSLADSENRARQMLVHWRFNYFVAKLHRANWIPEMDLPFVVRWTLDKVIRENDYGSLAVLKQAAEYFDNEQAAKTTDR